jgi:glycine/D-amino acid oxidase-like deaminating enzyme
VQAVELVRTIIGEEGIDARIQGDAELEVAHSRRARQELFEHAVWQRDTLGLETQCIEADAFREGYFDSAEQFGAVLVRPSFALHPLRYHLGLARAAVGKGAVLHPGSEVIDWSRDGDRHVLRTATGSVRAKFVIVAANGFMPEALHPALYGRMMSLISAIVVTRPLSVDELAAHRWQTECPAINARRLLNYFRLLPDRRLLFGGRGHSRGTAAGSARNLYKLAERVGVVWPSWREVGIDFAWHGLICMTRRLTPVLTRMADDRTVYMAYGYHGNGVNNATWSGRQLADWLATDGRSGNDFERRLPAMVRGDGGRFPLAALRLWYLQAILAGFRLRDRFS